MFLNIIVQRLDYKAYTYFGEMLELYTCIKMIFELIEINRKKRCPTVLLFTPREDDREWFAAL